MMKNDDDNEKQGSQEDVSSSNLNRATVIFALCAAVNSVNVSALVCSQYISLFPILFGLHDVYSLNNSLLCCLFKDRI